MNTPAHLLLAAAALARPAGDRAGRRRNWACLLGALAPDVSFLLLAVWARRVQGHSARQVFEQDFLSPLWQAVFRVDNSIPLWALLLALALAARRPALAVFAAAALLHLALDLPLHHSDARPHFWPLSDAVFRSPLSYWNPARHGHAAAAGEAALALVCAVLLWRRFRTPWPRALVLLGLAAEAAPLTLTFLRAAP